MPNVYVQTLEDAKSAAHELERMGEDRRTFSDDDTQVEGWLLTQLGRNDHTWPDGDWREESSNALVDEQGRLWIHLTHNSFQTDLDGSHERRYYTRLTQVTATDLRTRDIEGGEDFRKIKGAIKNLV